MTKQCSGSLVLQRQQIARDRVRVYLTIGSLCHEDALRRARAALCRLVKLAKKGARR